MRIVRLNMQTRFEVVEPNNKPTMKYERTYSVSVWVLLPITVLLVASLTLSISTWITQGTLSAKIEELDNVTATLGNFIYAVYLTI